MHLLVPKVFGKEMTGLSSKFSINFKSPSGDFSIYMDYTTYIIYSPKLDKYYIGYTENLEVRLEQHNTGISTFTSKANDWVVKYTEIFPTRETAKARETEIKKKKSRKYIEWLISSTR